MLALFERYPLLQEKLPYSALGEFPTPVEKLERLGEAINVPGLYAKREDLSGKLYGGNKVRALEFLLGEALRARHKQVLALGFPASCAALAQAIYARQLGLRSMEILFPVPTSEQARRHLLIYQSIGAELYLAGPLAVFRLIQYALRDGRFPKHLEASTPLGMAGYVSAALELRDQVDAGMLPEPDLVYVALASMGTAAGLDLGLKAAGLKSRVVGVHLGNPRATPRNMARLFRETDELLHAHDPSFPEIPVSESDFEIRYAHGKPKGLLPKVQLSEAGKQAIRQVKEMANLGLDEVFTADTFAALIADAEKGSLRDKTVLWWNSYSSRDFSEQIATADYRKLPKAFHRYFEQPSIRAAGPA